MGGGGEMFPGLDIFFSLTTRSCRFICIKIKWSLPYASEYLCSRSASRTKHVVWISSVVDIHLLDITVCATLKLCLKFNVNQTRQVKVKLIKQQQQNKQTNKQKRKYNHCTAHNSQLLTAGETIFPIVECTRLRR